MEFRILGPLEVWDDGRQLELGGSKRRAVLAFLVLHANEVVSRDRLIDELWGEQAPRNASAALHSHVSRLRKQLGPDVVATRAWGYVVRTEPGAIDLERFEELVDDAQPLPARERAEKLREALGLWRGGPFGDLAFEPALARDVARLEELRLAVLESRIDADLEAGHDNHIVGELETLVAGHPLRERLRGQLILALYRGGRQAEALEVYRETRRVLADELGLEPSPELRELERAILRHDPSLARTADRAERINVARGRAGRRRLLYGAAGVFALAVGVGVAAIAARRHQPDTDVVVSTAPAAKAVALGPARPLPGHGSTPPSNPAPVVVPRQAARSRPVQHRAHRPSRATAPVTHQTTRTTQPSSSSTTPGAPTRTRTTSKRKLRIADSFNSDVFDGTIWYVIREGSGFDVGQQDGRLVWSFQSGATPGGTYDDVGGHYGTRCRFPGDFDARVDYAFVQWPAGNGVVTVLWASLGPKNVGAQVSRSSSPRFGEQYGSWLPPQGDSVSVPDSSGSLRIARVNGVITTYFLHDGAWRKLASNRLPGAAAIAIGAYAPAVDWQGEPVTVAFDNFVVSAPEASCPPGAQPGGD